MSGAQWRRGYIYLLTVLLACPLVSVAGSFSVSTSSIATFYLNEPDFGWYGEFSLNLDGVLLGKIAATQSQTFTPPNEPNGGVHTLVTTLTGTTADTTRASGIEVSVKDALIDATNFSPDPYWPSPTMVTNNLASRVMVPVHPGSPRSFRIIAFKIPNLQKDRRTNPPGGKLTPQLEAAVNKLRELVMDYPGANFKISSAVRPDDYQAYLYEMNTAFKEFRKVPGIEAYVDGKRPRLRDPKGVLGTENRALMNELNSRINAHGLNANSLGNPAVNPPGKSNHASGDAVDIRITGLTQTEKDALAKEANLWRPHYNPKTGSEEMHYELSGSIPKASTVIKATPKVSTLESRVLASTASLTAAVGRLLVYNDAGLRVGYDPTSGEEVLEWPGSEYSGKDSQEQIVILPPISPEEFRHLKFLYSGENIGTVTITATGITLDVEGRSDEEESPFYQTNLFEGPASFEPLPIQPELPNFAPVAFDDGIFSLPDHLPFQLDPLQNDVDLNGDVLTLLRFSQPANGTLSAVDGKLFYDPADDYWGLDSFEYVITDNKGGEAIASVILRVPFERPTEVVVEALLGTGSVIVGSPGTTEGIYKTFGTPAIDDERGFAALVGTSVGKGTRIPGVVISRDSLVTVLAGNPAPGFREGTKFKSFSDPILTPSGSVAFAGVVSGPGVTKDRNEAVWTDAFSPKIAPILREGEPMQATGSPVISKMLQIAPWGEGLLALVRFKIGTSGVSARNDTALLFVDGSTTSFVLREGGTLEGDTRTIVGIAALVPAVGSPGHGRTAGASICARLNFSDKSRAIVTARSGEPMKVVLYTGQDVPASIGANHAWRSFGFPSASSNRDEFAVLAKSASRNDKASSKDHAVLLYGTGGEFQVIAQEGGAASGVGDAKFKSFLDPVVGRGSQTAFIATVAGPSITRGNNTGLWTHYDSSTVLLTQKGGSVPDPDGATMPGLVFSAFTSVAFPAGEHAGPIFLAKVSGPGANKRNNVGLWGVSTTGQILGLLRHGDVLEVDGQEKVIAKISLLDRRARVAGASRSFNAAGSVALQVLFTDRSQSILRIDIP